MFIGFYCCLLVMVQPLSLAWADLHHTDSLWALFQGPIVEFRLGYSIFYLGTSEIFTPTNITLLIMIPIKIITKKKKKKKRLRDNVHCPLLNPPFDVLFLLKLDAVYQFLFFIFFVRYLTNFSGEWNPPIFCIK